MNAQLAVQKLLQKELAAAQQKNQSFSMRSFSSRVELNPGALSGILNGKRTISADLARRIAIRLHLDPQQRAELLSYFPKKRAYKKTNRDESSGQVLNYLQISASQFRIVAEWEHYALLSLLKTKDFQSDSEWIAFRLGITVVKASEVTARLIEVGMIARDPDGKLVRVAKDFRTTDDILDVSLQKAHLQSMDLAAQSMQKHSIKERDFSSLTMAIQPEKLSVAKELIRKFQDELYETVGSTQGTEVYRLSKQLFPLTQLRK